MNLKALTKNYDKLTADERFALISQALARDDQAEADCLASAAPRLSFSVPHTYFHADAFSYVVFVAILELLDAAAFFDNALEHVAYDDETGDGPNVLPDDDNTEQGDGAADVNAKPLWVQNYRIALAAGYLLKARFAGWQLWCKRRHLPPFAVWEVLPGYQRLMQTIELTRESEHRALAFTPTGMLSWMNEIARERGEPELIELPCTVERLADGYENLFQAARAGRGD
jgi:hypothetical protein